MQLSQVFQKHQNLAVFFVLSLIVFISGYWHINSLGLYGDDWGAATFLFNPSLSSSVKEWWHLGSGEILNFRMLAVIIPIIWFYAFGFFGLAGIILINFFIYACLAYLFFIILRSSVSLVTAFFGASLFALYPTNNAYLWHVTLSYSIAMLFVFGAVLLFLKQKYVLSAILLVFSVFINEGVFFVYFLCLIPPLGESLNKQVLGAKFKKWLLVQGGVLLLYSVLRLVMEAKGVTGGERTLFVLQHFNFFDYCIQFIKSFGVVLIIGFAAAIWKILKSFRWYELFVGLGTGLLVWYYLKQFNSQAVKKTSSHWLFLVFGLMLIVAGRYYGFYFVPSINVLNLDSRYYFAASVGGAVFFCGVFEYFLIRFGGKYKNIFATFCVAVLAVLGIFRAEVQNDYAKAAAEARELWKQLLPFTETMPNNAFVVVNIPGKILGQPVGLFEATGDLRVLLPKIYNNKISGVTSPFVQRLKVEESKVCISSIPFYENTCFNKENIYGFKWEKGKLQQTMGKTLVSNPILQTNNFTKLLK